MIRHHETFPRRLRTQRCAAATCGLAFLLVLLTAPAAQADFGFLPGSAGFNVTASAEGGQVPDTQAGSHPYALTTEVNLNLAGEIPGRPGVPASDGDLRDLHLELPPGLIENPAALPQCTLAQFHAPRTSPFEVSASGESCPDSSQLGVVAIHSSVGGGTTRSFGLFNLAPPPGSPSQLGFAPYGVPITLTPHIRQARGEYGVTLDLRGLPQAFDAYGLKLTTWGTPWATSHNGQRGNCLNEAEPSFPWAKCKVDAERPPEAEAYLTLPTSCGGSLAFSASADSWQDPGAYLPSGEPDLSDSAWRSVSYLAPGLEGCQRLSFAPIAATVPTSDRTSSASGLDFNLETSEEGLLEPTGLAPSQIKQAVVALPAGMTLNPSLAAGLGVCTPSQYEAETVSSPPGAGCPNDSKIGDFTVHSPLFEAPVAGSLFLAQPYQNPFGTLLALYLVAKSPEDGILVKVAGQVDLNPGSGQLTASFDRLPQLPYSLLQVRFREGQRAPLINPASCGTYASQIDLHPWLAPETNLHETSAFALAHGIGGAACPTGTPPFAPGAQAGTLNSNAGSYTPFYLHLTRTDAEQEITSYSAQLPPGLLGKIAGIPYCPDADIEAAKSESGTEETEHPSCPAASEIGHTVSGYGVGGVLAYAPGGLYLAGPYHGSPLSIVAIDSATVGPFDLGVIVVRSAIEVNPRNAQVSIDSAGSDPIPHIVKGIPLHLRDVRVYISRPGFTLNPTSCAPFSVTSTLTGSAAPFANPADIVGAATVPFQVSDCSSLKFAPKLSLKLKGGTKRGDYPSLRAVLTPHPGDAGIASAAVTLPPSEFLAQNHIDTICTRPQLEAEACPAGSVYGHASATTPLLSEPMRGPVYLRSSSNLLPDLVVVLHGAGIRVVLEGRIDSSHGGIRGTFEGLPDAPVTKFTVTFNGGKRGILVNEKNLCALPQLATARFVGQDNQAEALKPRLEASCPKHKKRKPDHRHRGGKR
jgi:hypothetical protein